MKRTYYYKGIKVRTSENEYKYAIIYEYVNRDNQSTFKLVACSTSFEKITKRFNQEFNYLKNEKFYSSIYGQHSIEKARKLKIVELEQR